ncbi:MEKHLA domain-containing protein [Synechococcus sp. CS-1325]|nr:MEKHLA domain-containing protein [Synechococcus sp. CS-1325]MCT0213574.1 MEKHLA domain-containing protein [Synechococcus sp. CS-1326]MCT0232165.1 MEKHLA domain-containing protein [Synechococcus sp. CS-1327]PZV01731.1 MAG: MEKHLA domain-containing protein [Cyanobium sp.]
MPGAEPLPPQAPWLSAAAVALAVGLLESHRRHFGRPLIACRATDGRQQAQELFVAATVVLAHDGSADPRLIYANAAALRLWRHRWSSMVGMPSRLTAEPAERQARARQLNTVLQQEFISGYRGIRIDGDGRRFQIEDARLWNLPAGPGQHPGDAPGQAAAFSSWAWL